METRGFDLERRDRRDDGMLPVAGRPVVYDSLSQDLGGFRERFARGSLDDSLSEQRDVGLLYSHDSAAVLASTGAGNLRLLPGADALAIEGDLDLRDPDVQRLDAKIETGTVRKMSFGFRVEPGGESWHTESDGTRIRTIIRARLIEVSAVWLPAYTATSFAGRAGLSGGALAELRSRVAARDVGGRNLGQWLESWIHFDFTEAADFLAMEGHLTREERIALSSAIGDALAAFAGRVQQDAPQLYSRDPFDFPPEPSGGGDPAQRDATDAASLVRLRAQLYGHKVAS